MTLINSKANVASSIVHIHTCTPFIHLEDISVHQVSMSTGKMFEFHASYSGPYIFVSVQQHEMLNTPTSSVILFLSASVVIVVISCISD